MNDYYLKIKEYKPDIIIVAGWSNIIEEKILEIPKFGVVGFHPSNLPKDREDRCWHGKLKRGIKKLHYQCFIIQKKQMQET